MNEKEILNDMLNQEKQIVSLYSVALTEASTPDLRQVFTQNLNTTSGDQYNVFVQMRDKGYYPIKPVNPQEVQEAFQACQQLKNQM